MAKTKEPRKKRSDAKDLVSVIVRMEPRQNAALRDLALARAQKRGDARPDKSEIVREALDKHPELKPKR